MKTYDPLSKMHTIRSVILIKRRTSRTALKGYFTVYVLGLWFVCGLNLVSAQGAGGGTRAAADVFLRQLTTAKHHGMGGSFVGSTAGADALNSNPAGLTLITSRRFMVHTTRFPRTIAVIAKQNDAERYEDYGQFERRAAGIELIHYIVPSRIGVIGFDLAFEHDGKFSRVNHLGKATGSFPQNNFAIGIGYGTALFGGLGFGLDARWMRSKVQDAKAQAHIGHGYAYNLGLTQQLGTHFRIGAVLRNLSNGLSFFDDSIPDRIQRDAILGVAYQRQHRNVAVQVGLDLNPPFTSGIRTNLGGEVWYRGIIGGRIGYLRHTEQRFELIRILTTESSEIEERLWKAEGFTLGVGVNIGWLNINAAYTPQIRPVANKGETIRIEQGEAVYSFSIGSNVSHHLRGR